MDTHGISEAQVAELAGSAQNALDFSYSPYSNFRVGCALLTEDNTVIQGANVENASYGAGICAERTAVTRAVMEGHRSFRAILITSDQAEPISPCGICRQFLREFSKDLPVFMASRDQTVVKTLGELLPMSFGPENLGK